MFDDRERRYLDTARIGRLATADVEGRPHTVPICFAFVEDDLVTPIDEKPKRVSPNDLRRSRDIYDNPQVAVIVDHYTEDWSQLGWVQVRGVASVVEPEESSHMTAVAALRDKYHQYATHALEERPIIRITPGSVLSWGSLDRRGGT